jgi:hypothetical protein
MVCKQTDIITKAIESDPLGEKGKKVENTGLQACLSPGLASCGAQGAAPTCSNGREVFCGEGQPVCERKHKAGCDDAKANCLYDVPVCRLETAAEPGKPATNRIAGLAVCPLICETGPIGKPRQFEITEVCHATGAWLEEGQKYEITVLPPGPADDNYQATAWRDGDRSIVSTCGKPGGSFVLCNLRNTNSALTRNLQTTGILLNEHVADDGPTVFTHACRLVPRVSSRSGSTGPIDPGRAGLDQGT